MYMVEYAENEIYSHSTVDWKSTAGLCTFMPYVELRLALTSPDFIITDRFPKNYNDHAYYDG